MNAKLFEICIRFVQRGAPGPGGPGGGVDFFALANADRPPLEFLRYAPEHLDDIY